MSLEGKTALVVGGAAGIGAATARRLAGAGASVMLADISASGMQRTRDEIRAAGGAAQIHEVDLSKSQSVAEMAKWVLEKHGAPDLLLVTVVEYPSVLGDLSDMEVEGWKRAFEVNFFGYIRVLEALLPAMRKAGRGTVVLTASTAALLPDPSMPILLRYAAIKHGVLGLCQSLAIALDGSGIRVICLCPSATATENAMASIRESKFSIIAQSMASAASPDDVARHFVEKLDGGEFLICTHPNYQDLIVELASRGLDPLRYLRARAEPGS